MQTPFKTRCGYLFENSTLPAVPPIHTASFYRRLWWSFGFILKYSDSWSSSGLHWIPHGLHWRPSTSKLLQTNPHLRTEELNTTKAVYQTPPLSNLRFKKKKKNESEIWHLLIFLISSLSPPLSKQLTEMVTHCLQSAAPMVRPRLSYSCTMPLESVKPVRDKRRLISNPILSMIR